MVHKQCEPWNSEQQPCWALEPPEDEEGGAPLRSLAPGGRLEACAGSLEVPGSALSHRKDRVAAMTELAESSSPQPSCDQAGQVHGFLSFPFCKMRIPISPGCLGTMCSKGSLTALQAGNGNMAETGLPASWSPHCQTSARCSLRVLLTPPSSLPQARLREDGGGRYSSALQRGN